ncbi:organic cation transporter protein-like [Thrips palmi]|uniref:Organic cation transporter protein-like n=1 Tax=Thrips palmi TaxID=161013 RepID=A0A6P9A145_THRPL|nr:organic cation transporter protein-like [Thrips palmi]XP_034251018.1 organic cation transporter protein-like [Thrips palmi]XP_034251019.1 organic cation transporter protein-like [Thrips palmi]
MDIDKALEKTIGRKWGRYQSITFPLISVPYIFQALFYLSYVFTTMRSEHRCYVPECETLDSTDMEPAWLRAAIPTLDNKTDPCRRFVPIMRTGTAASAAVGRGPKHLGDACTVAFSNETEECTQYMYPNRDLSIMTEWDLTSCAVDNAWRLTLVGTLNNFGRIIGVPLSGCFSDKFGRRTLMLAGLSVAGIVGVIMSFSPNYYMYTVLEFFNPMFYDGVAGAAFIMGMELLPPRMRGGWSAYSHVIWGIGLAGLGGLAWAMPYWRWLLRVSYLLALASLSFLWLIPESLHWLVAHGRSEEACQMIRKAARTNRHASAELQLDKLEREQLEQVEKRAKAVAEGGADEPVNRAFSAELKELLRTRILVFRLINCCICWIVNLFVYEGLSIYSVSMSGDRYLNFVLVVLVEIPGALLAWRTMNRFGRRITLCVFLLLTSVCCFTYHFLPEGGSPWPHTMVVMLAKLSVTVSFTVIYVVAAEMFPTKVRHSLYAFTSTLGHLGSMLAPQTPLLARYMHSLPMLVFGCATLANSVLAVCFPETSNTSLPDTVEDAAALGTEQAKVSVPDGDEEEATPGS